MGFKEPRLSSRVRPVVLVLVLLFLGTVPPLAAHHAKHKTKKHKNPLIKLRADIQAGFAPLTIHFTGRLKNVGAEDDLFCHAGIFLLRKISYNNRQILTGEDPGCHHDPLEHHVPLTFSFTYVVSSAGFYEFQALMRTKDGTRILSNSIPVRALSGPASH